VRRAKKEFLCFVFAAGTGEAIAFLPVVALIKSGASPMPA